MLFIDPKELGGLHVTGRNDVTLGVVAGRSVPDARTRGVGRTMLHEHAVPSANQMS
jgi:hypothetical protein